MIKLKQLLCSHNYKEKVETQLININYGGIKPCELYKTKIFTLRCSKCGYQKVKEKLNESK